MFRKVQHFHVNDLVRFTVVQHDAWRHFLGPDNRRTVQTQVQRIVFSRDVQSQASDQMPPSKNTMIARHGTTRMFTATRASNAPNYGRAGMQKLRQLGAHVTDANRAHTMVPLLLIATIYFLFQSNCDMNSSIEEISW